MSMDKVLIAKKVDDFLVEEFEVSPDQLVPGANLKETLELDSLDLVDLVVAVEDNFGVKLVGEDFTGVISLQNLYDLIERKLRTGPGVAHDG